MKVRCTHFLDSAGRPKEKSYRLTIGRVYHVLELLQESGHWHVRLMGDEPHGAALFRLEQFEVVSSQIPSSWIVAWSRDKDLHLRPESWNQPGFLERYYDKDTDAMRVFEKERRRIIEADP